MTTTYINARDDLYSLVRDAALAFSVVPEIEYSGLVRDSKPNPSKVWLRVSNQIAVERQTTIGNEVAEPGQRRYTTYGLVIVEFYIPKKTPHYENALMWASELKTAFRRSRFDNSLVLRNARIDNGIAPEENFFRLNVIVDFEFDEIA